MRERFIVRPETAKQSAPRDARWEPYCCYLTDRAMVCGLKQCYFDVSPTPFITLTRCRAGAPHDTSLGLHPSPCHARHR